MNTTRPSRVAEDASLAGFEHDAPLIGVVRGGVLETVHRGTISVMQPDGSEIAAVGDIRQPIFWRSSAKPFQAMALILTGAAGALGLTDAELAVACSSHSGQAAHTAAVESILDKAGVQADALQCGIHRPLHGPTSDGLLRADVPPTAIHNNCSGKHAAMLATAKYMGWPLASYRDPNHPLQRLILHTVATFAGLSEEHIGRAVDGCGVPVFRAPVWSLALAFARLVSPSCIPSDYAGAAGRIVRAMTSHPLMVGGTGRFDSDFMAALGGRAVAKGGAQGVEGVGLGDQEIGLGLKISDGSNTWTGTIVYHVLDQLGGPAGDLCGALSAYRHPEVRNHAGTLVGSVVPLFSIEAGRS